MNNFKLGDRVKYNVLNSQFYGYTGTVIMYGSQNTVGVNFDRTIMYMKIHSVLSDQLDLIEKRSIVYPIAEFCKKYYKS